MPARRSAGTVKKPIAALRAMVASKGEEMSPETIQALAQGSEPEKDVVDKTFSYMGTTMKSPSSTYNP